MSGDMGACVLKNVCSVQVELGFKGIFRFSNVLSSLTLLAEKQVDDVCGTASQTVPDVECFSCCAAPEVRALH